MDFSKLNSNEKLAIYGAAVAIVLGMVSAWGETFFISILAAIAMLAVIFAPQVAPTTRLPGSKGSLMVAAGGVAAVFGVLEILRYIGYIGDTIGRVGTIFFLIAAAGAVVMAWAGWQEFQAEGGKFNIGMASAPPAAPPAPPAPMAAPAPPAPPQAPMAEPPAPMAEPMTDEASSDDEPAS